MPFLLQQWRRFHINERFWDKKNKKIKKWNIKKGDKQTDQKSNTEYLLENKGIFNIQGTILTTSFMIKHDMFILYVAALSGPNEIESQLARGRPNNTECKQQEKWV